MRCYMPEPDKTLPLKLFWEFWDKFLMFPLGWALLCTRGWRPRAIDFPAPYYGSSLIFWLVLIAGKFFPINDPCILIGPREPPWTPKLFSPPVSACPTGLLAFRLYYLAFLDPSEGVNPPIYGLFPGTILSMKSLLKVAVTCFWC